MDKYPLIHKAVQVLQQHESNAPVSNLMRQYIVGARHALEAVELYLKENELGMQYLMQPQILDKVPKCLSEVIKHLQAMRESGTNPYLRFRLVDSNDPKRSWYPVEYDGEYKLWGYVSDPETPGLRIFYIQELPLDLTLDTEFPPKFLQEMLNEDNK